MARPMYYEEKPEGSIKAYTGSELHCKNWDAEAALHTRTRKRKPASATVYIST